MFFFFIAPRNTHALSRANTRNNYARLKAAPHFLELVFFFFFFCPNKRNQYLYFVPRVKRERREKSRVSFEKIIIRNKRR